MLALDPIWQPQTQQSLFRVLLDAMSHPGTCYTLPNDAHGDSHIGVLATLLDAEVTLADAHGLLNDSDWPLLQAKPANTREADYVLCDATRTPDFIPKAGTLASPDQSATLVLCVEQLNPATPAEINLTLTGPGIQTVNHIGINGLASDWLDLRAPYFEAFPLGFDLLLLDTQQVSAIARTSKVEQS